MSSEGRGIFDGESPPSTTMIFDDNIFDTLVRLPNTKRDITILFHRKSEQEDINTDQNPLYHSMETIILR